MLVNNNALQLPENNSYVLNIGLWDVIKQDLKREFGEQVYNNWLKNISCVSASNGQVLLLVTTRFVREWIINNYIDNIIKKWQAYAPDVVSVDIIVEKAEQHNEQLEQQAGANVAITNKHVVVTNNQDNQDVTNLSLDSRFTFDTYIVGASNQLAYSAAFSVADADCVQPGCNPLFLYGGVGLGKTHLMHAIAWHISKKFLQRKVTYISAEKFMYEFIQALRNKNIMAFKEKYRSVDVLMIDDVQFICGKDSTQEEFFHTFNALIDNNCQLVISCDRSPSDLSGMEERIRSRLGWGLVADVHDTDYELRIGILQSKVERIQCDVPKEVIEFLASKITSNVRELEGALNKVMAYATLVKSAITIANTKNILKDLIRSNEKIITVEEIKKCVAEYYNIRIADMSSARRTRNIVKPRQIAMFLAKKITSDSLVDICKSFGKKDHTTVIHAVKKTENSMIHDSSICKDIENLENKIYT